MDWEKALNVYVVHGSPLSGKSTYVKKHVGDNDIVFDYDKIMKALTLQEEHVHNDNLMDYILEIRSLVIAKLKSEEKIDNAYIIITKLTDEFKESLTGLNPKYIHLKINANTARLRLKNSAGNRDIKEWNKAIDRYFMGTEDTSGFHKSTAWERKRKVILKRDTYLCQECKRYGKTTPANTVHHIYPVEVRPDLKLNNNNLVSLCEHHHEAMHDKFKDRLSELGDEWLQRTARKFPELR